MRITEVMHPIHATVAPADTVSTARRLMQKHRLRDLPVVEDGHLRGLLSDHQVVASGAIDADGAWVPDERFASARVSTVMSKVVATLSPIASVEDAANLMHGRRVSCLPVIESGNLVGVVDALDVVGLEVRAVEPSEPPHKSAALGQAIH